MLVNQLCITRFYEEMFQDDGNFLTLNFPVSRGVQGGLLFSNCV